MLTMPFTVAVYMVRSFLQEGQSSTTAVDEQLVGQLTGTLVSSTILLPIFAAVTSGAAVHVHCTLLCRATYATDVFAWAQSLLDV